MGYQLGIDLGTTYTAAAVRRSADHRWAEPEVVTLGSRTAAIPSVLFVGPDGSVLVGEAAARRALTDPDRVAREFKRRIGDSTPVVVGGRAFAPEDLSARLVRWVVDRVAEREGGPATRIAVTHPAAWGRHKQELLAAALAAQDLTVTFLAEPQAAALHYAAAERVPAGATIAVYDLGGGTFDAAVVRKTPPSDAVFGAAGFGLLGRPEGLDRLGGVDFDEVVFEHVREGLPAAFADLDETDPEVLSAVARVRRECTEAKEALSADTEVSVPVLMPAARGSVRLHRSEFEALIRGQVDETVAALRTAVRSAGRTPDELGAVLLVGGSSRIPLVAQLVSEGLGRPVAVDADPKNAIAKGAALAVSPKPTASWPEVTIPPMARGGSGAVSAVSARTVAELVGASARGTSGGTATPARPRIRGGGPAHSLHLRDAAALDAPGHAPDERSDGATESFARPDRPAVRPAVEPVWEHDVEMPRRRPTALMVGVGALVAVAVIVAAVLLAQRPPAGVGLDSGSVRPGDATAPVATASASTPTPAAPSTGRSAGPTAGPGAAGTRVVTPSRPGTTRGGGASRNPSSGAGRASAAPLPSSAPTAAAGASGRAGAGGPGNPTGTGGATTGSGTGGPANGGGGASSDGSTGTGSGGAGSATGTTSGTGGTSGAGATSGVDSGKGVAAPVSDAAPNGGAAVPHSTPSPA